MSDCTPATYKQGWLLSSRGERACNLPAGEEGPDLWYLGPGRVDATERRGTPGSNQQWDGESKKHRPSHQRCPSLATLPWKVLPLCASVCPSVKWK